MTSANRKVLGQVIKLWDARELDKAMDVLKPEWKEHADDPLCIAAAGHIFEASGNMPLAYALFKLATMLDPAESSNWVNMGRCGEDLWRSDEAMRCYTRAMSLCNHDSTKVNLLGNLAALCIDLGDYEKAQEWAKKALRIDPNKAGAKSNLGFTQLALGNWAEGWANYRNNIGTSDRRRQAYNNPPEPLWDGSPGQAVVVYGEQGLGDEIVFASMVDDVAKTCRKVILDCDSRLENLFKRSFPQVTVYGTRAQERLKWAAEDHAIDAVIPAGQVGEYVRQSPDDCPREPWLVPDPFRVAMWKAAWGKIGKPVIGIAWSGGIRKTGAKFRHATLENWASLLELDAHFVSLEYRGNERHPKVHEYRWATRSNDYDDTAALVASLDVVVSVPTSVVHVAGAVGTPVVAMHSSINCWKYRSGIPFHHAHHVEWAGDWKRTIDAATEVVKQCLESSSAGTRGSLSPTTSSPTPSSDTPAEPSLLRRSA